jgi:hypothetical protein
MPFSVDAGEANGARDTRNAASYKKCEECGIFNTERCVNNVIQMGNAVGEIGAGYYDKGSVEHTFARMTDGQLTVKFGCYGSTGSSDETYPAKLYSPDTCHSSYRGTVLSCHPIIARGLANWKTLDLSRLKLAGTLWDLDDGYDDNSGLFYGLSGVCHQMCNTILCATNADNPQRASVIWPDSFDVSKIFYGFRGGGSSHDRAICDRIALLRKLISVTAAGEELSLSAMADLYSKLDETYDRVKADLANRLKVGYDQNSLSQMIAEGWDSPGALEIAKQLPHFSDISETYATYMNQKNEFDNDFLRETISKEEYAASVEDDAQKMVRYFRDLLNNDDYVVIFGHLNPDETPLVIDPDSLPPDPAELRRELKLT